MTTIGSSTYYPSLFATQKRYGSTQDSMNNGGGESSPQQRSSLSADLASGATAGITGMDTSFGAKLSSALWTMESQGVEIDQDAGDTWLGDKPSTDATDEFMNLAHQTFAERVRDQYLKSHDLTEDDLKAMSPEDRAAVEDDIRKTIMEAMGVNGDKQDALKQMGAGTETDSDISAAV